MVIVFWEQKVTLQTSGHVKVCPGIILANNSIHLEHIFIIFACVGRTPIRRYKLTYANMHARPVQLCKQEDGKGFKLIPSVSFKFTAVAIQIAFSVRSVNKEG